jgi:hypothetical protein
MEPILGSAERRLLLRYETGRAVCVRHVRNNAADAGIFALGTAIGSIQEDTPEKICVVVTRSITR